SLRIRRCRSRPSTSSAPTRGSIRRSSCPRTTLGQWHGSTPGRCWRRWRSSSEMPRPNREAEIRRAALRCFSRLGYDATRVKHIAAEAGVSDAALYAHWKGKEELAADIYAEGMTAYGQTISGIAARSESSV